MLARVTSNAEVGGSATPAGGCEALLPPYRGLLDVGCDPLGDLAAMGLPQETVDAVISPGEVASSFSYNPLGHLRLHLRAGAQTKRTTDTDGRSWVVDLPNGAVIHNEYDEDGFLVAREVRDELATKLQRSQWAVDHEGRVLASCIELGDGGCALLDDDAPPPELTDPVDPGRLLSQVRYSHEGLPLISVSPHGAWTILGYDSRGFLATVDTTVGPGWMEGDRRREVRTLDAWGRVVARQVGVAAPQTEAFDYDGFGAVQAYTDRRGNPWHSIATPEGWPAASRQSAASYVDALDAPAAWQHSVVRDPHGQVIAQTQNGLTTSMERDEAGRVVRVVAPDGGQTLLGSDGYGRFRWSRDATGNLSVLTEDPQERVSTRAFVRQEVTPLTSTRVSEFDVMGRPVEVRDVAHADALPARTTLLEYDLLGRTTALVDPLGRRLEWSHDRLGRVIERREPTADGVIASASTYEDQALGLLVRVEDPSDQVSESYYDAFGQLRTRDLPGGGVEPAKWTYDDLGRLATYAGESGESLAITWSSDAGIERESWAWTNAPGGEVLFRQVDYDGLGRPIHAETQSHVAAAAHTVVQTLAYDAQGRVSSETLKLDEHPMLASSSGWVTDVGGWTRSFTAPMGAERVTEYDQLGRPSSMSFGAESVDFGWNGELPTWREHALSGVAPLWRDFEYDSWGDVAAIRDLAGSPVVEQEFDRDDVGRLRGLIQSFSQGRPARWEGYAYDSHHRLASMWRVDTNEFIPVAGPGVEGLEFVADELGAPRRDFVRDPEIGNLLRVEVDGVESWSAERGPGHQLESVVVAGLAAQVEHDEGGRIVDDGRFSFQYDPLDRLTAALDPDTGEVVEGYIYDAFGRMVAVADDSGLLALVHDGAHMVEGLRLVEGDWSLVWEAAWGGLDELLWWRSEEESFVPLLDQRRSVIGLWADGVSEWSDYSPRGKQSRLGLLGEELCTECGWASGLSFGFTGGWSSPATGLVHRRARFYSASLGWMSRDPLGFVDGFDPFQYVGGDPVNRVDPWGEKARSTAKVTGNDLDGGQRDLDASVVNLDATVKPPVVPRFPPRDGGRTVVTNDEPGGVDGVGTRSECDADCQSNADLLFDLTVGTVLLHVPVTGGIGVVVGGGRAAVAMAKAGPRVARAGAEAFKRAGAGIRAGMKPRRVAGAHRGRANQRGAAVVPAVKPPAAAPKGGAGEKVAEAMGPNAGQFGKCEECAAAAQRALTEAGRRGQRIRIESEGPIGVKMPDGITRRVERNGVHEYVVADGMIYDNVYPLGIPRGDYGIHTSGRYTRQVTEF